MRLNIQSLLDLYDKRSDENKKITSAISGMLGEDLAAGLIKHYFVNSCNSIVRILDHKVTNRGNGKRLDRWICATTGNKKILYQVEIKMWNSNSFNEVSGIADNIKIDKQPYKNLCKLWDDKKKVFKSENSKKVLTKMKKPENLKEPNGPENIKRYRQKALICYWMQITPSKNTDLSKFKGFFNKRVKGKGNDFKTLSFFSLSFYLRYLKSNGDDSVEIDLPNYKQRREKLNSIVLSESESLMKLSK